MKNVKLYHIPIAYMLVYTVAILGTGVWLFLLSQGLGSNEILTTLTKIIDTPAPKSMHHLVEVSAPHLFAMGMLIFVVAHFMLFSTRFSQKFSQKMSILLFIAALFNIGAYLFISLGLVVSGWIKLVSMGLFIVLFLGLLGMLTFSL